MDKWHAGRHVLLGQPSEPRCPYIFGAPLHALHSMRIWRPYRVPYTHLAACTLLYLAASASCIRIAAVLTCAGGVAGQQLRITARVMEQLERIKSRHDEIVEPLSGVLRRCPPWSLHIQPSFMVNCAIHNVLCADACRRGMRFAVPSAAADAEQGAGQGDACGVCVGAGHSCTVRGTLSSSTDSSLQTSAVL